MSFQQLRTINGLMSVQAGVSPWAASQFGWMKGFSTVTRGGFGAELVSKLAQALGYVTAGGALTQSFIVKGQTIKVKLSMLWTDGGLRFEQVEDDPYDHLAMLGLEPSDTDAFLWLAPKALVRQHAVVQHAGDSPWIRFRPNAVPAWLTPFGGSVGLAAQTFANQVGAPP